MPSWRTWPDGALGVVEGEVGVDRGVALALGGVDLGLGDERLEAEGAGLVGDDRGDAASPRRGRAPGCAAGGRRPWSSRPTGCPSPAAKSAKTLASGTACGRGPDARPGRAAGRRGPGRGPGRYSMASEPSAGRIVGAGRRRGRRRGSRRRGRGGRAARSSWALVIFLIWWVALRASISGPSVQPLIVLARMTVGRPACSVASL